MTRRSRLVANWPGGPFATVVMELRQRHRSGDAGGARPAPAGLSPAETAPGGHLEAPPFESDRPEVSALYSCFSHSGTLITDALSMFLERITPSVYRRLCSSTLCSPSKLGEVPASGEAGVPWSPRRPARTGRVTRKRVRSCVPPWVRTNRAAVPAQAGRGWESRSKPGLLTSVQRMACL